MGSSPYIHFTIKVTTPIFFTYNAHTALSSAVVALFLFVTAQCKLDNPEFIGKIEAVRECPNPKCRDAGEHCYFCYGTNRHVKGSKEVSISVVRENSAIKCFGLKREGKSPDKFYVHQVFASSEDGWLLLILKGYSTLGTMADRWVKVSKSREFLEFLLTQEGALKYEPQRKHSKTIIKRALENGTSEPELSYLENLQFMWKNKYQLWKNIFGES